MTERKHAHVTPEEVEAARTPAGGWTRATLESWGIHWPPQVGWRRAIMEGWFDEYLEAQGAPGCNRSGSAAPKNSGTHRDETEGTDQTLLKLGKRKGDQLRVSLNTYMGRPFVNVRVWANAGNTVYPTKRGVTIRIGEIDDVIAALERAKSLADGMAKALRAETELELEFRGIVRD